MINPNSTKTVFVVGVGLLVCGFIFEKNTAVMATSILGGALIAISAISKTVLNKFTNPKNIDMPKEFWPVVAIVLFVMFFIFYQSNEDAVSKQQATAKQDLMPSTAPISDPTPTPELINEKTITVSPTSKTTSLVTNKPTLKPTAKPTQVPAVVEKPKSDRDEAIKIIKANAQSKWGSDYEMVAYTQNNQIAAYDWVARQTSNLDIMARAKSKWGYDFEMVKYTYQNQVTAYEWIMKQTEYSEIMSSAKNKWGGDYEMVKYTYENQVEAYKNL